LVIITIYGQNYHIWTHLILFPHLLGIQKHVDVGKSNAMLDPDVSITPEHPNTA